MNRSTTGLPGRRPRFDAGVGKVHRRRKWQSTPVLLPGKSHGWRSMVGYSPWGHKELDMTERLHFYTYDEASRSLETYIRHFIEEGV